jgi:prepilin-type N-terminal cleavage/methylation domain-containing protein
MRTTRPGKVPSCRRAFTLVEMLITLAIMLLLAGLIVAFAPRFQNSERASRGADLVMRWLLVAKQQARRDGIARGVHLVVGSDGFARSMEYIEQPSDYILGAVTATTASTADISTDLTGGFATPALWAVQPGDFLEINGAPPECLIATGGILPATPAPGQTRLTVTYGNLPPVTSAARYRIIRAPRPTQGLSPLDLPQNVAIDLNPQTGPGNFVGTLPSTLAANSNILFLPSGAVRHTGFGMNKIMLWVHDTTDPTPNGQHTLITVYTSTGLIAAHPIDTSSGDAYSFTRDGRSSGI